MKTPASLLSALAFALFFLSGCSSGPSSNTSTATTTTTAVVTPAVISISPAQLSAGSSAATLTVTGSGFLSSTVVQVAGTAENTTFVSSTQVSVLIPAAQLASGALLNVIATNGSTSSASGPAVSLEVDNPVPAVTQAVPASFFSGTAATTLSIAGTGFVPTTVVQVNGAARSTAFVSSTQVNVNLTTADLATAGSLSLTVVNAAPGGGSASVSVPVNNPVPGALTLMPATAIAGTATPTTVTVTGSNFLPSSTVLLGTTTRATTYVSATKLTFQLSVADQAAAGRLSISVVNPVPGGGASAAVSFIVAVATPTPVLTQVIPAQFLISSSPGTITAYGSNLTTGSVVLWNGTPLVTTYGLSSYGTYLSGVVPASLLASAGTASITISSPTSPVPVSNAFSVSINNPPAPTLTAISPTAIPIHTATSLSVNGSGFTAASTVALNGINLPTTYVSSSTLTAAVPTSAVPLPGNQSITVSTPAPGGGTSAVLTLTAYIGIANNSMIFNPVNGLFYLSVPSSAGAPYGNSVVSVDPATGTLGTPIFVGSEPNKLALTSDGRYLWVGLDGAGAVRKVDLTAGVAGLQFALGGNGGIYDNPYLAAALAALPGATDSVVVSLNSGFGTSLNIYDSGVPRTAATSGYYANPSALLVDGTRNEIYAGLSGSYYVYTYTASGLKQKTAVFSGQYANSTYDEMQIANGRLYTDFGTVYDPESGSLLGTFYNTGTTAAAGTTTADTTLGKVFVLDSFAAGYPTNYNQIQIFNTSDYNLSGSSAIPVSVASSSTVTYANRLTRWGSNGLAFRTSGGVYSLRSNLVKDLSGVSADLGVTLVSSGATATGANTTYTATVTNAGPSAATAVTLTPALPSTAVLISASAPCSAAGVQSCSLSSLASGASTSVTYVVAQNTAGSVTFTAQVAGSENDPVASNNQASNTTAVTGSTYALAPSILSLSPSTVEVGAADTVITVNGANFTSSSTVLWNGSALVSSYVNAGKLTATVPAAKLSALGWGAITVSTPAPGGGTSAPSPLTVFQVLTVGVNHLLYDQYDRKLYASVGSGSSTITGNSIAAITPETGTIGTPVPIGSQPTKMAMSDDGNILYTILGGASSVARFNLLTGQADYTVALSNPNTTYAGSSTTGFRDLAVQSGVENTIALDFGYTGGLALVDFTPSSKSAALRGGTGTGIYTGTSLQFFDAQTLLVFNSDTWQTLDKYPITSAGFAYGATHTSSTLYKFSAFKLRNGIAYANAGGVADPNPTVAVQLGSFPPVSTYTSTNSQVVEPDVSLSRIFFLTQASSTSYYSAPDSIVAYDKNSYLPLMTLPLPFATIEGNTSYTGVDLVRWGQDGLAVLTSGGHIYLLRGPVVVPQELNANTAATLTASSSSSLTHGAGNTILTLTGTNFVPGVAVSWNGNYRVTTIVDATHVTVALPATDFTAVGSGSLVATNPGASASSALTITIN